MFDNGDGRIHWNRCEEGHYIIGCDGIPFPKADGFYVVYKVLSVPDMMRGMPYQWPEDVSQVLGHLICDHTSAGSYGSKGGALFVYFG